MVYVTIVIFIMKIAIFIVFLSVIFLFCGFVMRYFSRLSTL